MMLLVKFKGNWADEMNLAGWYLQTPQEWALIERAINEHKEWPEEVGVGTNEQLRYHRASEMLGAYKAQQISEAEAVMLKHLFGSHYGQFPAPWENWDEYGELLEAAEA